MTELKNIVKEEVRRFLYENSYVYSNLRSDPNNFLNAPKTQKDEWARQIVGLIENLAKRYSSHKLQRFIINNVFHFDAKNLSAFDITRKYTKHYLDQIRYVLNHIQVDSPLKLLQWYEKQMSILKTELNWVLEYLAYNQQKEEYFQHYMENYKFFKPNPEGVRKQFENYYNLIKKHIKEDYS